MTLENIISGCKNNDTKAQSELYKLLHPKLIIICKLYGTDSHQANDFLQDGFMYILSKMHMFKGDKLTTLRAFAGKLMKNKIIDYYRKNEALSKKTIIYDNVDYDTPECDNFELYFNTALLAIDTLSPKYKKAVNMFYLQDMRHREIAKELGISEGTSKSNLSKAMFKLKKTLTNLQLTE